MTRGAAGPESTIGGRIASARFRLAAQRGKNVTQAWLAAQCGVSGPTVSQWETGVIEPTVSSLKKIAKALGVTVGWLAAGETAAPARAELPDLEPQISGTLSTEQKEASRARRAARKKKGNSHGRTG
jgi:transcriptional regulator with XRE-family HTH domain